MSSVFQRAGGPLPTAVSATGAWVTDSDGHQYLDAAGGAIVVGIGHGDRAMAETMAAQTATLAYVHGSAFTTQALEDYATELATVVPMEGARVFPVSGGSEAMETALKMARAYHLGKRRPERTVIIARGASYHGNTRGALDVSGREPLRRPYEPWLGQTRRVPGVNEYRCPNPGHPAGCAAWHASRLTEAIEEEGPERVVAFVAEPIGGAASGAAVPPDAYWESISEICRRHDILIIADEVMTGFGRTGEWFASDHFGLRPDILVAAKGASSGYWPLGLAIASGVVHDIIVEGEGLVHGFTWSHHPVGARVGLAVLDRIRELRLIDRARTQGARLHSALRSTLANHPRVGDVRGIGLLACVELVADRETLEPFPRQAQITESVVLRARQSGLLLYPSTGNVDGINGDYLLIGPPLTVTDDEVDLIVDRMAITLGALG
ncbi:MAG TPA: aminotransferase class III-fold pyridoxal phosphate-dependent enzyme [Acidimicrobiia bacterium]|nr:aminotransferase class III-fold pyridoxal phosphate-dependent enzyme [Acidimicrobiia bacterium]